MKVSTILDHVDSGDMALPKFQRGYVWNRDQVRGLMDSLYRRHPVGSLLVWATPAEDASHRGDQDLAPGVVRLLLDGQQRITSLYGIIRGEPPAFFDGNKRVFTDLYFHIGSEEFRFYQPLLMRGDPLWINVSELMRAGNTGLGRHITRFGELDEYADMQGELIGRLNNILGIREVDLHVEEVTGADKTIDVVVDIFNRVNSGGTKLSQGDLALAKICGSWPEGREEMQSILTRWRSSRYDFNLDWLLRNVNAIVTGEARFSHLHDETTGAVQEGLRRAEKSVDYALNLIAGRLGLDHDRVLFGRYALPVMSRYIDRRGGHLADAAERDRLLYWYFQSAMWGRFSGSTESVLDQDLEAIEGADGGIDRLIEQLRLWHGSLRVEPAHFRGWSLGARFYPVLYALTRVGEAQDWGTGLVLRHALLGRMNALEVHHIFPKALLYRAGFARPQVNAVANFCFLTKNTNLQISDRPPSEYFREIEARHPGALASQWIRWTRSCGRPRITRASSRSASGCSPGPPTRYWTSSFTTRWPRVRSPRPARSRWRQGSRHPSRAASRTPRRRRCSEPSTRGSGIRACRGPHRARARASGDGRPARDPRPRMAGRTSGGLQRAGCTAARRGAGDAADRERPRVPPLHRPGGIQALRGDGGAGPGRGGKPVNTRTHRARELRLEHLQPAAGSVQAQPDLR